MVANVSTQEAHSSGKLKISRKSTYDNTARLQSKRLVKTGLTINMRMFDLKTDTIVLF